MDEQKLTPTDIKGVDDLHKMPVLTAAKVREHNEELVSQTSNRRKLGRRVRRYISTTTMPFVSGRTQSTAVRKPGPVLSQAINWGYFGDAFWWTHRLTNLRFGAIIGF